MTIMEPGKVEETDVKKAPGMEAEKSVEVQEGGDGGNKDVKDGEKDKKNNVFSEKNLLNEDEVDTGRPITKEINLGRMTRRLKITPEDKIAFLDSIVNNTRFEKSYELFGGKITMTARSLTSDEVNALAAWTVKQGTRDPNGVAAGRYRKFIAAAQVSMLNGVQMPPLEEPLFETLAKDGKNTVPPGWINRFSYWESMSVGLFGAVMECLKDFDMLYSTLCGKAEDSNFWNPDTP